jgi:hypothetical protein
MQGSASIPLPAEMFMDDGRKNMIKRKFHLRLYVISRTVSVGGQDHLWMIYLLALQFSF